MINALIVYASWTGTTEGLAEILAEELRTLQVEVLVKEITEVYPKEFLDYNICVVATYTYGADGSLPEEAEDFYYDLAEVDLSGKIYGVIGSGDRIYDKFCPAADAFDQQFEKTNATCGALPLKIHLDPEALDKENIKVFARNLLDAYTENLKVHNL